MNTFETPLTADEAIDKLKTGVEAVGLRVVAHINGQANAKLIGKEVPADQILEIFRPDYAIRVWDACKPAGHDIPLRIHVYDDQGTTKVACRLPSTTFAAFDSPALAAIGNELDGLFEQILAQVPRG
jgi:uncharacterized protein (DUF302 family)